MRPTVPALVLMATVACSGDVSPPAPAAGPSVVATLHPLASVVRAVGGSGVEVRTLLPPGAHPDTYEASPRDAEAIAAADLVVRVGGAADAWVATPPGVPVVAFIDGVDLLADNPHVWLDPILVRDDFLPRLTDALVDAAPDSAAAIRGRATAYADSLTALDDEIRDLLADAPTRRFVSAHPAWVYFAERYDLEPVGVLHGSPGREVGTRELARLVDDSRARGLRAVIAEPQLGRAGADALAAELDARVELADPVGGPNLEGRDDYLSLMRFNARAFARALGAASTGAARP